MDDRKPTIVDNIVIGKRGKVKTDGISKILLDSLSKTPNFIGQINADTGEKISFGELKDRSIRCALWLRKQGIGKDDVICISTPNQTNDCIPILASFYVGAIISPWFYKLPSDTIRRYCKLTKPKVIFTSNQSIEQLVQIAKETGINCKFVTYEKYKDYPSLNDIMSDQNDDEVKNFEHTEPEDQSKQVGMIFFSSGTTGVPKGTILPYHCLTNHRMEAVGITEGMNVLWYSAMSWITGVLLVIHCIEQKATRIINSTFDPTTAYRVIKEYEVNLIFISPTFLVRMFDNDHIDLPSLQYIFCGGAKSSAAALERVRKKLPNVLVSNCYGMTEAGGAIAGQTRACRKSDSIGYICYNTKLKVLDPRNGKILGPNQEGEFCFKMDHIMSGYLDSPEETMSVLDSEGWIHSGDLGYYDETGELSLTDRMKEVIFYQNQRIPPSQIQKILTEHPAVASVVIVPVPHEIDLERPFAFVKKTPGAQVTAEELVDLPAEYDENYRLSGGLVFIEDFPLNSSQKVDMQELKRLAKIYALKA
ncbi:hypothetical protein QAD02_010275 [Eretmocerus hayati]|uniref:Uncharacterized protein n=1 Tax=Eretmocerus hayati TaxID=131215 RepID=A0ACC2NBS2_9HYME|nr:hypothetical protein QAD02_010275 [Eretmocerus hayati]